MNKRLTSLIAGIGLVYNLAGCNFTRITKPDYINYLSETKAKCSSVIVDQGIYGELGNDGDLLQCTPEKGEPQFYRVIEKAGKITLERVFGIRGNLDKQSIENLVVEEEKKQ